MQVTLYDSKIAVIVQTMRTGNFKIGFGIRQGDALSAFFRSQNLYICFQDGMLMEIQSLRAVKLMHMLMT